MREQQGMRSRLIHGMFRSRYIGLGLDIASDVALLIAAAKKLNSRLFDMIWSVTPIFGMVSSMTYSCCFTSTPREHPKKALVLTSLLFALLAAEAAFSVTNIMATDYSNTDHCEDELFKEGLELAGTSLWAIAEYAADRYWPGETKEEYKQIPEEKAAAAPEGNTEAGGPAL